MFGSRKPACLFEGLIAEAERTIAERAKVQEAIEKAEAEIAQRQSEIDSLLDQLATEEAEAALAGGESARSRELQQRVGQARARQEVLRARARGLQPKLQPFEVQLADIASQGELLRRQAFQETIEKFHGEYLAAVERLLSVVRQGFALASFTGSHDQKLERQINRHFRCLSIIDPVSDQVLLREGGIVPKGYDPQESSHEYQDRLFEDWASDEGACAIRDRLVALAEQAERMKKLVEG